MRLGYLLLANLARGESGFDEDITLQQENYKTVADLGPSLPIFDLVGSESESSGTLHPGQFESSDENEQVAVIFTEIDKVVDRANIIVPQSDDEEPMVSLESRSSSMHNRNRIKDKKNQILDELVEIEQELQERQREDEIVDAEENTMIIAIAAGAGCLLMLSLLLGVACCISRKRARRRQETSREKHRRVEANPVEQTFERLDFTHASIGTSKRQKKTEQTSQPGAQGEGDVTSSEMAPSSMGTLRTYIDRSNTTMVKNCLAGNESDFRNTSSDIDSIESSNPPKKMINHVIAEKKKYSGYQELATRDRSNYSSSSTASSCEHVMGIGGPQPKPTTHHVILEEGAPPAYETITRSRDSVIDL